MTTVRKFTARSRCFFQYLSVLLPLAIFGGVALISLVVFYVSSWDVTNEMKRIEASAMGVAFRHVAGSMQPLLEADRATVAIAAAAQDPTSNETISQQVRSKMFVAFAMQPQLAQVSYAGTDGAAFAYYRGDGGAVKALFTDPHNRWKWNTQPVDPVTGRLVGSAAAAVAGLQLPTAAWALLTSKNASRASVAAGWARPGTRMLFFSALVSDGAGVVSTAVAIDDLLAAAASFGVGGFEEDLDMYYAVGASAEKAATYKPLLLGKQPRYGDTEEQKMRTFSKARCAASAIDAPKLGKLVAGGHGHGTYNKYKVACTNFDIAGVQLGFRLVLRTPSEDDDMARWLCIPVVVFVCLAVAVAAAACVLAVRALRRAAAREARLNADLVRQKEALRQAERKSMNKSNAFASASHDIRSALAAIAGLVEMSRPEAQALPGVMENLDQMAVCTNKLFDILNSILDTTKVESGKMQLQESEFSMADVLQESVDMANVTGVRQGLEVVWDPCDLSVLRCAAVTGDCKRLKQILDNLLGNALKFTDEGYVVLKAWANRPIAGSSVSAPSRFGFPMRIGSFFGCLFRAREDGDGQGPVESDPNLVEFYFEVVDTGIGIPREKRLSVFENYVQVNDGQGGTGLGLGIVQSFVRLMGGEISIKEKLPGERGTCFAFNVLLKLSEAQEPQDIEEGTSAPSDPLSRSKFRASVFQEATSFKGVHCVLYVHGGETMRILQAWMESIGVKVWLVLHAEFIASTLEKVLHNGATPAARPSASASPTADDEGGDRCFSSKEMVSHVSIALRNGTGARRSSHGGNPSAILVVIDVSCGGLEEIFLEMEKLVRIKHQAPCKFVLLDDIRTPSDDLRRFKELGCDLVLRKPVHGSRLFTLLMTLRDLQDSDAPAQSYQVGPEIAGTSQQQDLSEIVLHGPQEAAASTETASLAKEQKPEDQKPLAGMQILLVEDTLVLQTIQRKMLSQLGATVRIAQDGAVAVNLFKEALEKASVPEEGSVPLPYHVIFMDCQMPNMDGYEATKLIREEEQHYAIHTPIIALTANDMEEDMQKAIHAGMDLHLTKPINGKKIVEAVSRVCKREN
ncbi:unnamed protein product [Urochloa decumbens]|uniref:Probable histidine kinase 2 n=1 Tax=Urochloa decumbens TaxID=240449 RepID=A0ABC9DRJ0_9POAL